MSHFALVPKKSNKTCMNDLCFNALTFPAVKVFEKCVVTHLQKLKKNVGTLFNLLIEMVNEVLNILSHPGDSD